MNGEPKIKYMTFKTTLMIKHKKKKKNHIKLLGFRTSNL